MIQIVQLHGTDKKLYELVAPLVMSPEVLKQNYNYPFRTSEEYEWFVALDNKHVVGFVPVEHKKYECVINNYYIKERNVDTLKLLLEKVLEKQGEEFPQDPKERLLALLKIGMSSASWAFWKTRYGPVM